MGINFFSSDSDEDCVVEPVKPSAKVTYTVEQIVEYVEDVILFTPITPTTILHPKHGIEAWKIWRKQKDRIKSCGRKKNGICPKQPSNVPPIPDDAKLCTGCNKTGKDKK